MNKKTRITVQAVAASAFLALAVVPALAQGEPAQAAAAAPQAKKATHIARKADRASKKSAVANGLDPVTTGKAKGQYPGGTLLEGEYFPSEYEPSRLAKQPQ